MRNFVLRSPSLQALLPLVLLACGPSNTGGKGPITPPPPVAKKAPPSESPSRWSLHPSQGSGLRAKLEVGAAGTLYVGDGGERWLDKHDGGSPIAATQLLPETLVAAAHGAGNAVLLVGISGTIYSAPDALGTTTTQKAPQKPLRSVTAGKASVVAIADDGSIVRTIDGGATWAKSDLPAALGTPIAVALNEQGAGVALYAPQRALVTVDDGASWKLTPTPGLGARRVVLDVNGDLMIEGLEASAVLKLGPPRFERVSRAPKSEGLDLPMGSERVPFGYARSVMNGRAAFLGPRYVEVVAEPDDATRWRVSIGAFGATPDAKKVPELNGCSSVFVGGSEAPGGPIWIACDGQGKKPTPTSGGSYGSGPMPPAPVQQLHLYRSDDEGKTWKDDGAVGSEHQDFGRIWLAPDDSLIIEGACKKAKYGCGDGPPVIRVPGSKSFAKIGVPKGITRLGGLVFSPKSGKGFSTARASGGPLALLVSADNGRDFTRVALPTVPASDPNDPKKQAIVASRVEPSSISVDEAGVVYVTAHLGSDWVIYKSEDDGLTVKARLLSIKPDAMAMEGKHGFAYERHGKGWETLDGGATWTEVAAPPLPELGASPDRSIACGSYGCLIGDRATRIGWGEPAGATAGTNVQPVAPPSYGTPLKCTVEGAWTNLATSAPLPTAYEAEPGGGMRWLTIKQDPVKGSVTVIVGKAGGKDKSGIDSKEISLFGPAPKDTATRFYPQIEGAAAIRYAFKREAAAKGATAPAQIVAGQKVDVEVAWYVAATGKVNRATIHGAGPLDPKDVSAGIKDTAAVASVHLLSLAQGGVHVRPFYTRPDVPLYFVHEGGKVEHFTFPELPSKDASGALIAQRPDAIRVGNRSVVVGVIGPGVELVTAWANDAGTSWETRVWGLWPDMFGPRHEEVAWDFTYVGGKPVFVAEWPGGNGIAPVAWGVPVKGSDPDPSDAFELPTQKLLADPPRACDAAALATPRVVAPYVRGSRHPVIVVGEGNEMILATGPAVLHGSGKDACAQAYEVVSVGSGGNGAPAGLTYSAIVSPDDLTHVSLFRTGNPAQELAVRPMTCSFVKGPLPAALSGIDGFE